MRVTTDKERRPPLIIVCGPTAVGKTGLALALAERYGGEIVSADSRQIYRLMDVGTAKPTPAEQGRVRHHLLDVAWPDEVFNAARFSTLAVAAIEDIRLRGRWPFLVGGTGLYIKALTEGLLAAPGSDAALRHRLHARAGEEGSAALHEELARVDPVTAERLHPNDLVRLVRALEVFELTGRPLSVFHQEHGFNCQPYRTLKLGLNLERSELYRRVDLRAEKMFSGGLLQEARALLEAGYDPQLKVLKTIGYRQAFALLRGELSHDDALEDLKRSTRRYAKQQLTWFRHDPEIIWVDSSGDFVTIHKLIEKFHAK